jgi:hypothetical protein
VGTVGGPEEMGGKRCGLALSGHRPSATTCKSVSNRRRLRTARSHVHSSSKLGLRIAEVMNSTHLAMWPLSEASNIQS